MRPVLKSRARALGTALVLFTALALPFAARPVLASAVPASARPAATGSMAAAGQADTAAKVPRYDHIAVIMFTSHDSGSILHNRFAPNFNRLAKQYGLASHPGTFDGPNGERTLILHFTGGAI